MIVKIKRLREGAEPLKYQTADASGFDLASAVDMTIEPGETRVIPTGWGVELFRRGDVLYELQVRPRGGTSLKTPLRIANSPGTVDVDYRGEVGIIAWNTGSDPFVVKKGDRIAQGVICPVIQCDFMEVDGLTDTQRGGGAYGHTGVTSKQ